MAEKKNLNAEDNNFILPQTEYSVKRILGKVSKFFANTEIVFAGIYVIYTLLRIFFMDNLLIENCILFSLSVITFAFEFIRRFFNWKNKLLNRILLTARRLVCCIITVVVFAGLFDSSKNFKVYELLFAVAGVLGLIMCVLGDVFNATIPVWADEILESFKKDIEVKGLVSRSFQQIKEAANSDDKFKKTAVTTITVSGGALLLGAVRKFLHRK